MRRFTKLLIPVFAPAVKIRLWGFFRVPAPLGRGITLRSSKEVIDDHQG